MNYRLFSHGDVSYRFNGKNDNVVLESKIIHSKAKLFRFEHDKERKTYIVAAFYYGLLFLGRKCLHATSQKRAISLAISLAMNYRLFSHGDVSYRFNGKNDNVVLEYSLF